VDLRESVGLKAENGITDMPRTWLMLLATMMGLLLAGCPALRPVLNVAPGSLALNQATLNAVIRIENSGGGTLRFTVETQTPWIKLSEKTMPEEKASSLEGTATASKLFFLQVDIISSQVPNTPTPKGEILITSNGGDKTVKVAITREYAPLLVVSTQSMDFGQDLVEQVLTITNQGNAPLEWQLAVPANAPWLSATPLTGTIPVFGGQSTVTVQVDRNAVTGRPDPYTAVLGISSNGGSALVNVSARVPYLRVAPTTIEYGRIRQDTTRGLSLVNQSDRSVTFNVAAETVDGGAWLAVSQSSVTVPARSTAVVNVTALVAFMAPGAFSGAVTVSVPGGELFQRVPVSLTYSRFDVTPLTLEFGEITSVGQNVITLTNQGTTAIPWSAQNVSGASWLSFTPASGTVAGGASATVTVSVDPTQVDPGTYTTDLRINADNGFDTVGISFSRPRPAALRVAPTDINLGDVRSEETVAVWNDGIGTVTWSIDTSAFPAWLTLDLPTIVPLSGSTTQIFKLRVDRNLVPAGETSFSHTFAINAEGDFVGTVPVTVSGTIPKYPVFQIIGEGTDVNGTPFINLAIGEDTQTFTIVNSGDGDLTWRLAENQVIPGWITSVNPQQGQVRAGRQQTVTVAVDRSTLGREGATYNLVLESNDPLRRQLILEVQVRVPFRLVIGTRPSRLALGRYDNTAIVEVANLGDAGETLQFEVESTRPEWLFVEPRFGQSIGVPAGIVPDWRQLDVSIDRSRISSTSAVGKLIVRAINVPPDALPVTPVEIEISVDVADLTIETALPMLRPPSLLRANLLLRDSAFRPLPFLEDDPDDPRILYPAINLEPAITEDNQPVETTETNIFVKKDENLSFNVLIMLDFSGSMREAANALVADGQLTPPSGTDPLTALYQQCIGALIDELPPQCKVALGVFNERRPYYEDPMRLIYGAEDPGSWMAGEAFVKDKDVLRYRLNHLDVVDNGATQLLPAVLSGAATLYSVDRGRHYIPFDSGDESILILVSDGRRTTPPGELGPVRDFLEASRTRVFSVGWGNDVLANTLVRISSGIGGHYYATENRRNEDGTKTPLLAELLKWCRTDPGDPVNASSIPKDLRSHVTLQYVSLNESTTAKMGLTMTVTDRTPPISGYVEINDVPYEAYSDDVRLGQIGMKSDGLVVGGDTVVTVYMDYAPRNISQMAFTINVEDAPGATVSIQQALATDGGLFAEWSVVPAVGASFQVIAPAGRTLRYGDWGPLFHIVVSGATAPFVVRLSVDDPVISGTTDGKYFTYPDTIRVTETPFRAPSLPLPRVTLAPDLYTDVEGSVIDLNAIGGTATMNVFNKGGSHLPTDVQLYWTVRQGARSLPGTRVGAFQYNPVDEQSSGLTETPTTFTVEADTAQTEPGLYSGEFYLDYNYGSIRITGIYGPIWFQYEDTD